MPSRKSKLSPVQGFVFAHCCASVICMDNAGYEASLIAGKVYRILPDTEAAKDGFVRLVDESGEDYLFSQKPFCVRRFSPAVRRRILELHPSA